MASAQVLPNSRKLGHLEAGKKKLEEFRKKKAEGRAKKAASTGQLIPSDVDQHSQKYEHARDGAKAVYDTDPYGLGVANEKSTVNSSQSTIGSSSKIHGSSPMLVDNNHAVYGEPIHNSVKEIPQSYENSGIPELANGHYDQWKRNTEISGKTDSGAGPVDDRTKDQVEAFNPVRPNTEMNMNKSSFYASIKPQPDEDLNSSKVNTNHPETSSSLSTFNPERVSGQKGLERPSASPSISGLDKESAPMVGLYHPGSMNHNYSMDFGMEEGKFSDSISLPHNIEGAHWHASEPPPNDSIPSYEVPQSQYSFGSPGYGTISGRTRPSFLDSLGVSRVSPMAHAPAYSEPGTISISFDNSKVQSGETRSTSPAQPFAEFEAADHPFDSNISEPKIDKELSMFSFVSPSDGKQLKQGSEDHHASRHGELFTSKKDEDFASLEQYIEDLTQEKFSLQRALETSRALAESLAAENSSLTESYNQQGQVVSQLKSDMERLQEEIKAQLLALESLRLEYMNAQLECNAADERAKILASEVIGLEEKALRLRSNELKLEKQLEKLNSEVTSYKRKVSILDKERQDFQSTIDALQEEKKLLHSKFRKASTSNQENDSKKTSTRRDVSTSTEDLEPLNLDDGGMLTRDKVLNNTINSTLGNTTVALRTDASTSSLLSEEGMLVLPDASRDIPHDQLRMIENINSLISELALEKEELVGALKVESSNCAKLKDLNKDLSQKLEAQTQRLELVTAQRMTNENILTRPIDAHSMQDATYADEGDEVVERVLGWIMKLFPGGPSKRRTSKLL